MVTFLLITGIILFFLFSFLLYCCIRAGATSNKVVEQFKEQQAQNTDGRTDTNIE